MTSGYGPISSTEHRLIVGLTFFGFSLRVVNLAVAMWFAEPTGSFAIYSIFEMEEMMSPAYSFIVFLVCSILVWRITVSRLLFSGLFFFLLAIFFDWWLVDSQQIIADAIRETSPSELPDYNPLLLEASPYDVITFFLVNILLVWNVVAVFRLYRFRKDANSSRS